MLAFFKYLLINGSRDFFCLLLFELVNFCLTSHHERRLYDDLMRDYNVLERPVENHSQPVTVYLKVSLQQLIDVDEKNQIVWYCFN